MAALLDAGDLALAEVLVIPKLSEARLGAGISQRAMSALLSRPYTFMQKVESLERQINPVDLLHCCKALGVDFIKFMTRFEAERSKLPLSELEAQSEPSAR